MTTEKTLGASIGRPCCGGRKMIIGSNGNHTESKFLESRDFKGWSCSVNWFFLHIEQQTNSVYHHQTCQAKFDGTRGPISTISDLDKIIDQLEIMLDSGSIPVITCPKQTCGCGLCAPKSKDITEFFNIIGPHLTNVRFNNAE